MHTKETCVQKYEEYKLGKNGDIPEYREFLEYLGINKKQLSRIFGASAYSKLQELAGDVPNRLKIERTPFATIMHQYGSLVTELGVVPAYPEWDQRGLRPTDTGLRRSPHCIKWTEMPAKFLEWATENKIHGFDEAIRIIQRSLLKDESIPLNVDPGFSRLIRDIRDWTPSRRRNSEGEYKIELRMHLLSLSHKMDEEFGESRYDLFVKGKYAIELKKDPDSTEYDRLFGQLARHLQHTFKVIVLIFDATRKDKYDSFTTLVDKYLNVDKNSVEIMKK